MTETKKSSGSIVKLALILFMVAAVTAGILGIVNYVTKDRIAEIEAQKTAKAFAEVLVADSYDKVEYTGASEITGIFKAGDAGYVVQLRISGAQGMIDLVVGVDNSITATGVSIISHGETPGLGAKATEPEFRDQFVGTSGTVAVTKDGGEIEALTGATITSRAVTSGVNSAIAAVAELG